MIKGNAGINKRNIFLRFSKLLRMLLVIVSLVCVTEKTEKVQAWAYDGGTWRNDVAISGSSIVTSPIYIRGNVTVYGVTPDAQLINSQSDGRPIFVVEAGSSLTIQDIRIDCGSYAGGSEYTSGVLLEYKDAKGGSNLTLDYGTQIYGAKKKDSIGGAGVFARNKNCQISVQQSDSRVTSIYGCEGFGIAGGTVYMHGGQIHDCGAGGVYVNNFTMSGGCIYNNNSQSGANVYADNSDSIITLTGGQIYGSDVGVQSAGTVKIDADAKVFNNRAGVIGYSNANVLMYGGAVRDNREQGVFLGDNATMSICGGKVTGNGIGIQSASILYIHDGASITGNTQGVIGFSTTQINMDGGTVSDNSDNGVFLADTATMNMSGGYVRNNSQGVTARISTTKFNMSGGEICNNAIGAQIYGTMNMSGGYIHNNTFGVGLENDGDTTGGVMQWTDGKIKYNEADDIHHQGKLGDNALSISGNASVSEKTKIFLHDMNRYVTTNNGSLDLNVVTDCYARNKILVKTSNSTNASHIYNKMTFEDKKIDNSDQKSYTKRVYGNTVAVWDKYVQTTKNYKFDQAWKYFGNDTNEWAWGGEDYTVKYYATPENYRNYAIVRTDPSQAGTTVADTGGQEYVCKNVSSENIFYACYYPKNYTIHFDGNGATGGTTQDQIIQYGVETKLNKNGFVRGFTVGYDINGGSSAERSSDSVSSDFAGWKVSPAAINPSYSDEQTVKNIAAPGTTRTLYAGWHDNAVTLPNASKADEYWEVDEEHKGWVKYYFLGWYTAPEGGQCVGRGGDAYTPKSDTVLYAHWSYDVCVYYDGNTNDGGGMPMDDPVKGDIKPYGQTYTIRENGYSKTGYDFFGWNTAQVDGAGNLIENGKEAFAPGSAYNEDIPLTLFAAWRNRFDIAYMGVCQTEGDDFFDNNSGNDYSQLSDTVKLSKAEDMKIDTTKSFIDSETGEEVVEDVTGTGVGWAFAKDIEAKYPEAYIADDTEYPAAEFFALAREAGAFTYGSVSEDYQGEIPALNSPDMAVANLYRVWDYGPLVEAYDLYYTLDQAQSGYITEAELLSHAKATDEEDGEITGGDHEETGNSFRVMTYQASDFTQFAHGGSVTETYLATDSVGNTTKLQITVHIADTTPTKDLTDGSTRFISEKYYNLPFDQGGLEDDSLWKSDSDYAAELQQTFNNLKNDTPVASYKFDHNTILEMQEFVKNNGVGNSKSDDALSRFYNQFLVPNQQ